MVREMVQERDLRQPPISRLCELSQRPLCLSTHLSCFATSVVLSGVQERERVQERDLVTAIQQPSFSFSRLCEHDKLPKSEFFFSAVDVEMGIVADAEMVVSEMVVVVVSEMVVVPAV